VVEESRWLVGATHEGIHLLVTMITNAPKVNECGVLTLLPRLSAVNI
jgi:hypothetical protein